MITEKSIEERIKSFNFNGNPKVVVVYRLKVTGYSQGVAMTRRSFLKLTLLLSVLPFIRPLEDFSVFPSFEGENYDYTPRRKGKIFKSLPPTGEIVKHRGTFEGFENIFLHRSERV